MGTLLRTSCSPLKDRREGCRRRGRIAAQVEAIRNDGGANIEKVSSVSAGLEDRALNGQCRRDARLAHDGLVQNATAGHGAVPAERSAAHDGDAVDVMNAATTDRGDVTADGTVQQCEGGGKVADRAALGPTVIAEGAVAQRRFGRNGWIISKGADRAAPATVVAVEGAAFDGDHAEIRDAAAGEKDCSVPVDLATLDRGVSGYACRRPGCRSVRVQLAVEQGHFAVVGDAAARTTRHVLILAEFVSVAARCCDPRRRRCRSGSGAACCRDRGCAADIAIPPQPFAPPSAGAQTEPRVERTFDHVNAAALVGRIGHHGTASQVSVRAQVPPPAFAGKLPVAFRS